MNLEDLELVEKGVNDMRFGTINIYSSKSDSEYLIMEKCRKSYSLEEYTFSYMQTKQRMKLRTDSILEMLWVDLDDENWITKAYFEYPNQDLRDRKQELQSPIEIIKVMNDILEAIIHLQDNKMIHGDIRPEYIYYSETKDKYMLLDRLINTSPADQIQNNNILDPNVTLFMSPNLFNQLIQGNFEIKHNPFKSEVFALGMVILTMFCEESEVNSCYNKSQKEFSIPEFMGLAEHLKNSVLTGDLQDLIREYLFMCVINIDEKDRCTPETSLRMLIEGIWQPLSNTQSKIENESDPEIQIELEKKQNEQIWACFLKVKQEIENEDERGMENQSEMTGVMDSMRSGSIGYINHEKINMPNMGIDLDSQTGNEYEYEDEDEGSRTENENDQLKLNESMPVFSYNPLDTDQTAKHKSKSISHIKTDQFENSNSSMSNNYMQSKEFVSLINLPVSEERIKRIGGVGIELELEDGEDYLLHERPSKIIVVEMVEDQNYSENNLENSNFSKFLKTDVKKNQKIDNQDSSNILNKTGKFKLFFNFLI